MKDSYWFRHDSTAGRALKMRKMAHIYGHEGKGLYWDVVEILRDQECYYFESDDSSLQMLCDLVGYKDDNRFISWFKDCLRIGLFELDDKYFFCPPLSENMKSWESRKANGSKGGRPKKTEPITKPITETKANQNHKRRGEEIRVEEKKKDSIDERKLKFASTLKPFLAQYGKKMLKDFYDYWTEPNKSGTKFRQELEKTWSLQRRLKTWAENDKSFSKNGHETVTAPKYKPFSDD